MAFVYDTIPYPGSAFAQTHPDRLATLATLFGMAPAPVDRCRVLEIGCTDGGNLIPMALTLPGSEFKGIDLAASAIAVGNKTIRQLGLTNIELRAGDLMEIDASWGSFDYIVTHGLFSWVPRPVREGLLRISSANLAPNGVAYISYNALPGGHLRRMVREMMLYHLRGVDEPAERIRGARALLGFLAGPPAAKSDAYRAFLKEELEQILNRDPNVLFHDELAEVYEPVFFHDFMAEAGRYGLQFLAEANYSDMQDSAFEAPVPDTLAALASGDRIAHEQYRDFLKCRKFRQTLLCHGGLELEPEVKAARVRGLHIASPARAVEGEAGNAAEFRGPFGSAMKTAHPLAIALIQTLIDAWPLWLHFDELIGKAGTADIEGSSEIVLATYAAGLVELHSSPPPFTTAVRERPLASPLARLQGKTGSHLTTLRHTSVELDGDLERRLIMLLDGTRDRAALKRDLLPYAGSVEGAEFDLDLSRNLNKAATLALLMR